MRVLCGSEPSFNYRFELGGCHPGVRSHNYFYNIVQIEFAYLRHVAFQQCFIRMLSLPFGVLRRQFAYAVQGEQALRIYRFFGPERTVVVEDGDAFRLRYEVLTAFGGYPLDELDYFLFGFGVVPVR